MLLIEWRVTDWGLFGWLDVKMLVLGGFLGNFNMTWKFRDNIIEN
jgi:hypothetical protein